MDWIQQWQSKLNKQNGVAPLVRTGGSRHTGLAALPYRNIQLCFIFQNSIMKIRKGCVSMRFLKFVGKMVLKLVALPVLFVLGLICLLAKLVVNVSSFAIGALILYILGCCIYCVFQSLWLQLGLLVGIGLAVYAVLFLFVLFQEIGEHIKENLRDFIFS